MTRPPESIVVCEGYHDRAFLRGWLVLRRGCAAWATDTYPPKGRRVTGAGQYAFKTPGGGWLRVLPAGDDGKLQRDAVTALAAEAGTAAITRIVMVTDADGIGGSLGPNRRASFDELAKSLGAAADAGGWALPGTIAQTRLDLVVWSASEPPHAALPAKDTLERLACAAIRDAHPARCAAVAAWLASRPAPPASAKEHKAHAASHMAGWWESRGYEGFFDAIWDDPAVASALENRLSASRALAVLDQLVT